MNRAWLAVVPAALLLGMAALGTPSHEGADASVAATGCTTQPDREAELWVNHGFDIGLVTHEGAPDGKVQADLANVVAHVPAWHVLNLMVSFTPPPGDLSAGRDFFAPAMTEVRPDFPPGIVRIIQDAKAGNVTSDADSATFFTWASGYVAQHDGPLFAAYLSDLRAELLAMPGVVCVQDVGAVEFTPTLFVRADAWAVPYIAAMPPVDGLLMDHAYPVVSYCPRIAGITCGGQRVTPTGVALPLPLP